MNPSRLDTDILAAIYEASKLDTSIWTGSDIRRLCGHIRELEIDNAKLQEEIDSLRTALNQQGHVIEFREDGWAIEHTIECRKTSLLDCPLNALANDMGGPPEMGVGRYRAAIGSGGNLLLERMA